MAAAAREFGISPRQMQKLVHQYERYRQTYPNEPGAEAFMPLPIGRPTGQVLTEQQRNVILYALAERTRKMRSAHHRIRKVKIGVNILDIHNFVKTVLQKKPLPVPSYQTVYRFIQHFKYQNEGLYYSIVNGDDAVEANLLAKRRNDVDYPNERWQSDACDPPLYVFHNDEVVPVTIIIIFDDYSKYIIAWTAIPKIKRDIRGRLRRKTFTAADVTRMLCSAMYETGVRPEIWYTDNGSQYIGADKSIHELNNLIDPPIAISHSRPRKPWGRGKVENAIGQLKKWIVRLPGVYQKRNRASILEARKREDLYTLDELKAELDEHFKKLNTQERHGKPSRYDLWKRTLSHPAPRIHQMATLKLLDTKEDSVNKIDRWSVQFLAEPWEPKQIEKDNHEVCRVWMDAIASQRSFPIRAVELDTGWHAEVLVFQRWIELVLKSTQKADSQHNRDSNAAFSQLKDERRQLIRAAQQSVLELTDGVMPERIVAEGAYDIPESQVSIKLQEGQHAAEAESQAGSAESTGTTAESQMPAQSQEGEHPVKNESQTEPVASSLSSPPKRGAAAPKSSKAPSPASEESDTLPDMEALLQRKLVQLGRVHDK